MDTAREPGESIEGEQITYRFGKSSEHKDGKRTHVSLGLHGKAHVAKRWRRCAPKAEQTASPTDAPSVLVATSARGWCNKHREGKRKVHEGNHRSFSGVMQGEARLEVVTPI